MDEHKQVAEMIRRETYFKEARAWYQTIYIGPIPERTFFLIIALLSGFIAITAILALIDFMPLTSRPRILVSNDRLEEAIPSADRIRPKGGSVNGSLMRFFVINYVARRESYDAEDYQLNYNFIHAHSNESTYAEYATIYGSTNPQSPAAILGDIGKRNVSITSAKIDDTVTPHTATVTFETELEGVPTENKTRWTATLQFYYSDLAITQTKDPQTGEMVDTMQDPQFQVVSYALSQAP